MFNEEQKQRFINTDHNVVQSTLLGLFNKAEMLEVMYDKDLYDFTEDQVIEFLKCLRSSSIESLGVQLSIVIKYVDWALSENLVIDGLNHFREITKEQRDECISIKAQNKYYSYNDIIEMCSKLSDNPVNQYVLMAPWYGIGANDRDEIEKIGIKNLHNNQIIIGDKILQVDQYFVDIFTKSCNTFIYFSNRNNKEMTGEGAWKVCTNTRGGNFRTKMNSKYLRISKIIGKEVNYNVIKFSAMLYYVKQKAEELQMSNKDFVYNSSDMIEILNIYEFRPSLSDVQRRATFWYKFNSYL